MDRLTWIKLAMKAAWTLTGTPENLATVPEPIAVVIEKVCTEKPVMTAHTCAALMASVGRLESGYRQVAGDCRGLKAGDPSCGTPGTTPTSFCFMQVHLPDGAKTTEGWTAEELMADPLKCARSAREILRRSIMASPANSPLRNYAGASGPGAVRFALAKRILATVPKESGTYETEGLANESR